MEGIQNRDPPVAFGDRRDWLRRSAGYRYSSGHRRQQAISPVLAPVPEMPSRIVSGMITQHHADVPFVHADLADGPDNALSGVDAIFDAGRDAHDRRLAACQAVGLNF